MNTFNEPEEAVKWLECGKILLHPTEGIWGIGCDAFNSNAVKKIRESESNGVKVFIAAAGMAAHLAGAIAAQTTKPVLGIPLAGGDLDGMDALLATVQMPKGVPVATFAIGKSGAINAAICAAQIIGTSDADMSAKLDEYKIKMHDDVLKANESIQ